MTEAFRAEHRGEVEVYKIVTSSSFDRVDGRDRLRSQARDYEWTPGFHRAELVPCVAAGDAPGHDRFDEESGEFSRASDGIECGGRFHVMLDRDAANALCDEASAQGYRFKKWVVLRVRAHTDDLISVGTHAHDTMPGAHATFRSLHVSEADYDDALRRCGALVPIEQ